MKIPFDSLTLCAVVRELQSAIVGARAQEIRQVNPHAVTLSLRSRGRTDVLILSCEADCARMHLTDRSALTRESAGTFTMALRKYIEGGTIASVEQVGFDRIAEITFRAQGTERRLILEIMGRHSNLVLVDADGTILDCAKHIGPRLSRVRTLLPGQPYASPPAPLGTVDARSPDAERAFEMQTARDPAELMAWLREKFIGMSPFLTGEIVSRCQLQGIRQAWDSVFGAAGRGMWEPILVTDEGGTPIGAYPVMLTSIPGSNQHPAQSVNVALDEAYRMLGRAAALDQRRRSAVAAITTALRIREARLADAQQRISSADQADKVGRWADLLLTLGPDRDLSAGFVDVPDLYADGAEIRIPVDPARSLSENAEDYYRKARRLRSAAQWAGTQMTDLKAQLDELRRALDTVASASDAAAMDRCMTDLLDRGLIRAADRGPAPRTGTAGPASGPDKGIRRLDGPDGWEFLVGLTAEGNDRLVRSHCAPHDFWFHVRAHTSAHVVVRNPDRKAELPRNVVEAAALIAARSSRAKHSRYVTVDYTMGKYVRRPRGAAHGRVTYTHERTINVDPTADRE